MKIRCKQYHHSSKLGQFIPKKQYDVPDVVAAELLWDFPERFEKVKPRSIRFNKD